MLYEIFYFTVHCTFNVTIAIMQGLNIVILTFCVCVDTNFSMSSLAVDKEVGGRLCMFRASPFISTLRLALT